MNITADQRRYARVAGITLLLNYVLQFYGDYPTVMIRSGKAFAETALYASTHEAFWRFALLTIALDWIVIGVVGFALYVVLEPVDRRLAQLALIVRLGTFFIGASSLMFRFAQTRIYQATLDEGPFTMEQLRVLTSVTQRGANGGIWTAWICQAVGTLLFFVLFLRSRYLPRAVAWAGIATSAFFLAACFVMFVLPQGRNELKLLGLPALVVEVVTALWLLIKGLPREPAAAKA